MMAATITLTDFLLSRIKEDEAAARAVNPASWDGTFDGTWGPLADLGERINPARVLAECAAKLTIVARLAPLLDMFSTASDSACSAEVSLAEDVLAALAAVHADHPDYRDEWRP